MKEWPAGASLVEMLVVLGLFTLVLGGVAEFVVGQGRVVRTQLGDTRFTEGVRASRVILGAELRPLVPGDVAARSPDSVRIRAFRGGGRVCSAAVTQVDVRYRGHRQPDVSKDSVVLVTALGEEYRQVVDVGGGACGGDGLILTLDAPVTHVPAFALLFETGAYHLAGSALRYRRGQSGRQPLIEALLSAPAFELADEGVRFEAAPRPDSLPDVRRTANVRALHVNPWLP